MPEISRFLGIVIGMFQWAAMHKAELMENWRLARQRQQTHRAFGVADEL